MEGATYEQMATHFSLVFVLALAANFIPMPQAASAAASQAELAPQGQVHPARGGPGTTFSFAIRGFTPATTIAYWATTPAGTILGDPTYTVETNQAGEASWDWTAPRTATFGVWTMVVQQVNRVRNTTLLAFEIAQVKGRLRPAGMKMWGRAILRHVYHNVHLLCTRLHARGRSELLVQRP
ncbi:MAG: hypothetical protein HC893_15840 [Chloroflexaceae bacterium]|nr:hypothetical protein [Chloroflexaceae bacterium]